MKKYVCLRDDDTCYFTSPNELINGYGRYWGKVPITLATVPFSHGSQFKILDYQYDEDRLKSLRNWELSATAKDLTEYHKLYPIGDNKEIVAELKNQIKNGMVEIAQHGVSHRYNQYGAETQISQVTLPMILDGYEYLSKVFEKEIKTYIPPSNTIDKVCAKYIASLGMILFTSGSISYRHWSNKLLAYIFDPKSIVDKLKSGEFTPIRRRSSMYMISSFTFGIFNGQKEIFERVKGSLAQTGFAAVGTHYLLLNDLKRQNDGLTYQEKYLGLIDKIQMIENVEFVTASEYFSLLMEKYYE